MLDDPKIQHLISWTANSDSFVIQPSHEFSKVLAYGPFGLYTSLGRC